MLQSRSDTFTCHPALMRIRRSLVAWRIAGRCDNEATWYTPAFSRRDAPEVLQIVSPQELEGAGKAGCALHPRSRVQSVEGRRHTSIQVQRRHPTFPARWFKAYSVLSPAIRICLSPSSALPCATLTPTLRLSGPHDFARPHRPRPSRVAAASTAAHPHVRDVRETPLRVERDAMDID